MSNPTIDHQQGSVEQLYQRISDVLADARGAGSDMNKPGRVLRSSCERHPTKSERVWSVCA